MSGADEIREYCRTKWITPARRRGDYTVSVLASDVKKGLPNTDLPQICGALGSSRLFVQIRSPANIGTGPNPWFQDPLHVPNPEQY